MAEITAAQSTSAPTFTRPYAPSWFDRFTDWVDRLPFPAPIFYLGLAVLLGGIQILLSWNAWNGVIYAFPVIYVVTLPYHFALMHYLDRLAAKALARIRPLLVVSDAEYDDLLYRLTTLPYRKARVAGFLGLLYGILAVLWIPYEMQISELHFVDTPLAGFLNRAFSPLIFFVLGVMIYHAIHQLNVVRKLYDHSIRIDLFALPPLYAFSVLSGLTAVGIAFISYIWIIATPTLLLPNLIFFIAFIGLALLIFILPLRGAHSLLAEEKERRLRENGELSRAVTDELHRRVRSSELVDMDNLNKTLTSLELERTALNRVSTWPWEPDTSRIVIAALLFPVVVWLLQWVLERVLA